MNLFDLIIGLWLLAESLLLGIFGQAFHLIGLGAALLLLVLACIFIYAGATETTVPRVVTTEDEARPQSPRTQLIKVTYAPTTELVVHEVIEQDQTSFFQDIITQMPSSQVYVEPSVNWVDGLALLTTQFPRTNDTIAENLAGKIQYQTVVFTRMLFHPKVNMKLKDQEFSVRLRKADNDPVLAALGAFLKGLKPKIQSHVSDLSAQNF